MSVKLRYKEYANGSKTPYLDIYVKKGVRKREFLKELRIVKPKNAIDRDVNKQNKLLAERIAAERARELQANRYDIKARSNKEEDFLIVYQKFIDKYKKQDKRVVLASYVKFQTFLKERGKASLTINKLNRGLIIEFKDYLEDSLKGETPSNYFSKFKKVILSLVNNDILTTNPAMGITIQRGEYISKDILSFKEIELLYNTPITNNEIKRAFLFSCFTGLRYSDIIAINRKHISNNTISLTQKKTGKPVIINLHNKAIEILKECPQDGARLFKLPSPTACNKSLNVWVRNSGIEKHITWHCARHSFATGLIEHGGDVNSASSLLGHTSFKYTQRYTHIVEKLKEKTIHNLPNF
ncbi:MAG: site-specific integrase [Bacteroidetes bacterium]|nr:site-specific integrase [Bacteroidota bacterium]